MTWAAEGERCPDCGGTVLPITMDTKSVLLVDAMPALRGNVAARFDKALGWRGYRLLPNRTAPPQHVTYREHCCTGEEAS